MQSNDIEEAPPPLLLTLTFLFYFHPKTLNFSSHEQQTLNNLSGQSEYHRPRSTGDLIPSSLRQTPSTSIPRPMPDLTRLYRDPWAESSDDEDLGSPFFATPSQRLVVSRRPGAWSNSPVNSGTSSVSPITMSAQKMSRAMQVRFKCAEAVSGCVVPAHVCWSQIVDFKDHVLIFLQVDETDDSSVPY